MEIGDVYKRTDYHRIVSVYYVVVVSMDKSYIITRREMINNSLVHENITWHIKDFLECFEET